MAGQVVHDHNIAGGERGDQELIDPLGKALPVDRLIEHAGRIDPVAAQGGDECHGSPMAIGHLCVQALTLGCPTPQRRHVGLGPSLVDEDQAPWINPALILLPLLAPPGDLWPELFGRQHAFF